MIPLVQFDPASMALFYDVQMIGAADPELQTISALHAIADGRSGDALHIVAGIPDRHVQARAIQVVSAMWHEKRHFLDFVLTNYGAFRFRQFVEIYINLVPILRAGLDEGKLHVPLEVYGDPVRRMLAGIQHPPESLVAIAEVLARRRKLIEQDRTPIPTALGMFELGGEAQLECLAFMAQLELIQSYFGLDGVEDFYGTLYNAEQFSDKYQAILKVAMTAGIVPAIDAPYGGTIIDSTLLECVVFASLQSMHLPPSARPPGYPLATPLERFGAFCVKLAEDFPDLCSGQMGRLDFNDCWAATNAIHRDLTGLDVLGAMLADHEFFRDQFRQTLPGRVPDEVETMIEDWLTLRETMLGEFAEDPQLFVSARRFALELADRLEPNFVACSSGGFYQDLPDGFVPVVAYRHPADGRDPDRPEIGWCWACAPGIEQHQRRAGRDQPVLGFAHPKAWFEAIERYAPLSKLFMNGRRLRTMLGPELLSAEKRLESDLGLPLVFFPSFAYPDESMSADMLYFLYGKDTLKCDLSSQELLRPNGHALHPWTVRRWPRLSEHVMKSMGGNDLAYFAFIRDWTPWVVSDEVYKELRELMAP